MRLLRLFVCAIALVGIVDDAAAQLPLTSIKAGTISCGTAATPITVPPGHRTAWLVNLSTTSIYLGGADVGQSGSICLSSNSGNCPTTNINPVVGPGQLYCRTASGTVALHYLVGL